MDRTFTAAKAQYGALQAKIINELTGNTTSYTKRDMVDAHNNNRAEFDKSTTAIESLRSKIATLNHFGRTGSPEDKFEQYIVARAASDSEDFNRIYTIENGNARFSSNAIEEVQRAFDSYLKCDGVTFVSSEFRKISAGINAQGKDPSMSFAEFARDAIAMEAKKNNEDPAKKIENAIFKHKTREELGWDDIHQQCKKKTGYGFTCYIINEYSLLNNVAHDIRWCVARDSGDSWVGGGKKWWDYYGGGPYYLICRGADIPFILMHARSHQFKGTDDQPFQTVGTVDRPSRAQIFQFAIDVLQTEAKEWDGEYEDKKFGYRDFQILKTVPQLDVIEYDFLSLLADPNCPSRLLQEAMRMEKEENVANAIVKNAQCPYKNLVKLINSKKVSISILLAISESEQLDDNLAEMILAKDSRCAYAISKNPKCSEKIMKKIIGLDTTGGILAGYLRKEYCPLDVMWKAVREDQRHLFWQNQEMYRSLLMNPATPKEILDYVISEASKVPDNDIRHQILSLCYQHPHCAKEMVAEKLKAINVLRTQYNQQHQNDTHPAQFQLSEEDKRDLEIVLKNPQCEPAILAQVTNWFYKQPDHAEILMSVAQNPSTPENSIMKIVERIRSNIDLATALVRNPNCPFAALDKATKLLDTAAGNDRQRTRLLNAILRNKNCTQDIKDALLYRKTFENIRDTIFPEDKLIPLCTDPDIDIAYIANQQLHQVYKKQIMPDGTIGPYESNKTSSVINRIARNITQQHIAFRIAKDFF